MGSQNNIITILAHENTTFPIIIIISSSRVVEEEKVFAHCGGRMKSLFEKNIF